MRAEFDEKNFSKEKKKEKKKQKKKSSDFFSPFPKRNIPPNNIPEF
jgi:hypothetical protein